jgi:hypothetical protein
MKQITLSDNLFLSHTKSAFIGGDNIGVGPSHFEWVPADADSSRFVTDSTIKDAKGPGQVAWLLEPFFMHPENYFAAMQKPFDAVLTHNRYFAENYGWLWYPHGGSWVDMKNWGRKEKTKNVSILLSEKNTMPGHKLRHEIARRFGDRFDDILGLNGRVPAMDAYAPYRYAMIVENERSRGYFTEKLIDCLSVGTIPIYWGCPDVGGIFYKEGMICFNDIESLEYIFRINMPFPDPDFYEKHKDTIYHNFVIACHYAICEDRLWELYPRLFE